MKRAIDNIRYGWPLILAFAIIFFITGKCNAQIKATTDDGKKVLLNQDGRWIYEPVKKDSSKSEKCTDWIENHLDKVTGNTTVTSKEPILIMDEEKAIAIRFFIFSGTIVMAIKTMGGGGCVDVGNKVHILFTDGSRMELHHSGSYNCEADTYVRFGNGYGNKENLKLLSSKLVSTMRVSTYSSYVEKDFDQEQAYQLMKNAECISSWK